MIDPNQQPGEFEEARDDISQPGGIAPAGSAIDLPAAQINRGRGALSRAGYVVTPIFEKYKPGQPSVPYVKKSPDVIALERQKYGDVSNFPIMVGTADSVVLLRPSTTRVHLVVQNTHATQNLFLAFDRNSGGGVGIVLPPGATIFYDIFVPQGDVHVSGSGASTTGVVSYSNSDLNAPYQQQTS